VIISRRIRWVGDVACKADMRGAYRVLVGIPDGKKPLGILRRRIILKSILKWDAEARTGLHWLRIGTHGGRL
jgi:hypothetical protein